MLRLAVTPLTAAYTTGAPADACSSMMPGHYASPQTSDSPYTITVTTDGSGVYTVVLGKSTTSTAPFMGFLIQARVAETQVIIGTFGTPPEGTRYQECDGVATNSVTHTTKANKDSVTLSWTSPGGDLTGSNFVVTFVQSFGIIWYKQLSVDLGSVKKL
jgi:hypothetical protein